MADAQAVNSSADDSPVVEKSSAEAVNKKEEAMASNNKIIGDIDAWLEWKAIAAWEGWLTMEQRGIAEEQEHLILMERAVKRS